MQAKGRQIFIGFKRTLTNLFKRITKLKKHGNVQSPSVKTTTPWAELKTATTIIFHAQAQRIEIRLDQQTPIA